MPDGATVFHEARYVPREHQRLVHERLKRFNSLVCHRRFGKTVLATNQLIGSGLRCKLERPRFGYFAPYRKQAKDVAWDFVKHYSEPYRDDPPNIAELWVELRTGARVTLYGADNPDSARGLYFDGVVLDEYGDMDPTIWTQVIRPALSDRKGWAIFIGTPKGQNGFHDLHLEAEKDPDWYEATFKASTTWIIDPAELAANRKAMTAEEYAQEFECSFDAPNAGAYYGKEMAAVESEGRLTRVPWEPKIPVTTAWDLGIDDSTAIWFAQQVGREIRIIDYYENSGVGLSHYVNHLRSKPYVYGDHLLPHDAEVKELGTGVSRVETLQSLGLNPTVVPLQRVEDGINAVRLLLPRCWFDADKTTLELPGDASLANRKRGVPSLRAYKRNWNSKESTWRPTPAHDWSSHGADAFRYLAVGLRPPESSKPLKYNNAGIV